MRHIHAILLLLLLLSLAHSRRKKEALAEQKQTKQERKTVVEANHYFSNYEPTTTYDINSVEKDKSLVFYLRQQPGKADEKALADNPITITLDAGSDKATCTFDSYTKLCSLSNVAVTDMKLKIECKKTPCELSWEIIQPPVKEADGDQVLDQLVAVNADNNHAALKVSCNNPELRETFADQIKLYTNSRYKRIGSKMGVVYFLFDNEEKGYYYLTSQDDKAKGCANATLSHANETIVWNDAKQQHMDFITADNSNTYQFKTIPDTDYRVEFSAHDLTFQKLSNTTGIQLSVVGYKGGEKKPVDNLTLFVDDEKDFIDFSAVFKKPTEKYDKMELQFRAVGNQLIVQTNYVANDVQEVQFGEESYFALKKGQKIKYRLVPLVQSSDSDIKKMNIFIQDNKLFKVNETSCEPKGCLFEVEAIENGKGSIYIGESEVKNTKQIIVVPFQKTVTKKIREGEQVYFSHKLKADDAIQLLINTPNAIAYAASKAKCQTVDEDNCFEKVFTYHNPSIYESTAQGILLIKVIALDNAEFTITVIDSNSKFIELKDTVPFTYLFDNEEKYIMFEFKAPSKQDVSFNLIAPANQLNLLVLNKEKPEKGDEENADWATDGFIKFEKKDVTSTNFYVKVMKKEGFANKWIHFTLIASTKEGNMRLQPGVAHYENIKPKDTKDYVFEFLPKKSLYLNFYTHNIKSDVKLSLKVSNSDDYNNDENTAEFTIDREVDVLNMALVSKKLCSKEDENCELFVRLQNQMSVEADLTITLLVQDSVIELKDGLWQNYNINLASASSHFYFIPNHQNHSTTIFYKSTIVDLKIMYNLWKTNDKTMDPSEWPFPDEFKENEKVSELTFKPLHFIHIEPARLKECWPNCVVLLSIAPDIQAAKQTNASLASYMDQDFKIMASNNFIELPEKHKVDIPLVKGESKELLVDLKYHLDKEEITFNTYFNLGTPKLTANVYTQKNPRCPTPDDEPDFKFTPGSQTSISLQSIKSKLSQNSMESDATPYLCVLATAISDSKFSIQFTSDKSAIKQLAVDTSTTVSSAIGQKSLFQVDLGQEVYLKVTREEGFPYFNSKMCLPKESDIAKCVQQFENDEGKGLQLADKVTTLDEAPCDKCTLLFKVTSDQPSKVDIHVQSKYAEVELAENKPLSDALAPNDENRYTLTGTKNEEIIINIQIISGNLKVEAHDFEKIAITKTNPSSSKNIHITIPPKDIAREHKQLGATYMTSFGMSSFTHLHLVVSSQNPKEAAVYTITYSSGEAVVYLQDGLISQYNLVAKKPTKFLYQNPTNSPIYLHVTTPDAASLNKLGVKMFALDDPEDEDSMITMTPEKPDLKKKTPNPTMLMQLPAKKAYFFEVTNNNDKDTLFALGINNREIMYLPFDHDFPVALARAQYVYMVINTAAAGYVKISFSKCDESQPFIGYTFEYTEFVNEDFQVEEQMTDELSQDLIIKVKVPGALYVKLRSPDDDTSLMSVKATFSPTKIQASKSKAGDKGLIQYQLLDSTKAELTFTSLVCGNDKNCNKDFSYSSLSSNSVQSVYSQLVCPSIMFDLPGVQQLKSPDIAPIQASSAKNNKITFTQAIKGEIEYVGVKAVNAKTGEVVYYQPVEIVTFWGQVHRTSATTFALGTVLLCLFACAGMVIYRRFRKSKEYNSLGELNDEIEQY